MTLRLQFRVSMRAVSEKPREWESRDPTAISGSNLPRALKMPSFCDTLRKTKRLSCAINHAANSTERAYMLQNARRSFRKRE
jgi:hypothetical protein